MWEMDSPKSPKLNEFQYEHIDKKGFRLPQCIGHENGKQSFRQECCLETTDMSFSDHSVNKGRSNKIPKI